MNKLLTTMLASSVLMMGAMTVAHADDEQAPAKENKQQVAQVAKEQQNESVKAAIKKTVEKYYNVNKTSK